MMRGRMRRGGVDEFAEEEEEFRRALDAVPPPAPPDGGWGWVVVFASFFMNMLVDGICYSYGILLPDLIDAFHTSTAMMSLGGAMLLGTCMMSGPVASSLCNRFGSRRIALLGCAISSLSLFFSALTERGSAFIVVFGLCGGVGFGLMFLSSLVVVGFYFEMKRGVAATLAMCGSSVGMAALAPLTRWLLQTYRWEGALIILTGIVLQGFVFSALLRPIDADLRRRKKMILKRMEEDKRIGVQTCVILQRLIEQKRQDRSLSSGSLNNAFITRDNELIRESDFHRHRFFTGMKAAFSRSSMNLAGSKLGTPPIPLKHPHTPIIVVNDATSPSSSLENSPILHRSTSSSPIDLRKQVLLSQSSMMRKNTSAKSLIVLANQNGPPPDPGREFSSAHEIPQSSDEEQVEDRVSASTEYLLRKFLNATPDVDRPMYRKDIYYTGSILNLPQYNNDINDYVASVTEIPDTRAVDGRDCWSKLTWLPKSIRDVLRSVFDGETFKSPTYIILVISTSLTMLGYYVPILLLPSFAISMSELAAGEAGAASEAGAAGGTGADAAMAAACLLSALGLSNTLGRVVSGVLGSRKCIDSLIINNIALLSAGLLTLFLPHCTTYEFQLCFAVPFGICVAAFSSLRSVIVVELMGLDKLTTCFSQLVIFHGISVMIGTPVAGYLYDECGDFKAPFYFAGGSMLLSGLLSLPLRRISQWEKRRNGSFDSQSSSEDETKNSVFIKPTELVGM